MVHKRADEPDASGDDDLPVQLLLQLCDLLHDVAREHRRVVPFGVLQGRGHDVLGHFVQPVRQFAAPGWPPRGEELVGSPTEQLGLGAQRLVEQDPGRLFATPLTDTTDPAAAGPKPSAPAGSWTTPSSVTFSLTTIFPIQVLLSLGVLSYHRGPARAHLPARSLKSCLR